MTDAPTDPRFLACLPFTLAQECPFPNQWSNLRNFSNDAHDPGGKTQCGIIQREYDAYRKAKGLPTQDIREISQAEGYDIYLNSYWLPYAKTCPVGLDLCVFDASVNDGSTEATKILQASMGLANDGEWGPNTARAVAAIKDVVGAIQKFTARRQTVYRQMTGFQYFGTDWIRRSQEIGAEAVKMVSPT